MELKEFLKTNKYFISEFSELLGCTRTHLSRIVNRRTSPSRRLANHIYQLTYGQVDLRVYSEAPQQEKDEK